MYQIIITIIIGLNCPSDFSDTHIRLSRFCDDAVATLAQSDVGCHWTQCRL